MSKEKQIQRDKEAAVKHALRHGMALIRRDLKVVGLKADGSERDISESSSHEQMWADASDALKKMPEAKADLITKENYVRLAADFENFRKEQSKAQEQMAKFASLRVVAEMLDALDLLDQAIEAAPDAVRAEKDWYTGLREVRKAFEVTLGKAGAEEMKTIGEGFDPTTMEAVGTAPGGTSDTVQSQIRAGWTMHGRVIRPARVIVFT